MSDGRQASPRRLAARWTNPTPCGHRQQVLPRYLQVTRWASVQFGDRPHSWDLAGAPRRDFVGPGTRPRAPQRSRTRRTRSRRTWCGAPRGHPPRGEACYLGPGRSPVWAEQRGVAAITQPPLGDRTWVLARVAIEELTAPTALASGQHDSLGLRHPGAGWCGSVGRFGGVGVGFSVGSPHRGPARLAER
jgi:hypothetical protein